MKLKRILFFATTPIAAAAVIVIGLVMGFFALFAGVGEMIDLAYSRFECWSADIEPGFLINCPWKTSYKEAFLRAF